MHKIRIWKTNWILYNNSTVIPANGLYIMCWLRKGNRAQVFINDIVNINENCLQQEARKT